MDALTIVFGAVDLPLVIGIVVLIELLKRMFPRIPKKTWYPAMILAGFGMAWLKIDVGEVGGKAYVIQGIVYSAAAEFAYQSWRTITESLRKGKGK